MFYIKKLEIMLIFLEASIFFCFLIPGIMYIKLNDYPRYHCKNVLIVIYMVVFIILCAISGCFTVKDIVNNIKWNVNFYIFILLIIFIFI